MIKQQPRKRRGLFLVLVLVVIVIATMSVSSFSSLMIAYDDASYLSNDIVQARLAGESGAEMIRLMLSQPPNVRLEAGGTYNNPQFFQAMPVALGTDGSSPFNFSVPATALNEEGSLAGLRFGLQNESARMNINALTVIEENFAGVSALAATLTEDGASEEESLGIAVDMLMGLPGMTQETANAIMDWLDEDDEVREPGGAELLEYENLPTPVKPANGPIRTVEELLLVQGVTPTLLFGADSNRNGLLDVDEQQRFNVSVDTPGALGWAAYLTVHGAEGNKTRDGQLRVNVNHEDLELMYEQLGILDNELYATYIAAYRVGGQPSATVQAAAGGQTNNNNNNAQQGGIWSADLIDDVDLSGGGGTNLNQVLDLIGSTVTIGQGDNARSYTSPFPDDPIAMSAYLPILMDTLTTQDVDSMPGRINMNECPAELLYGMGILLDEQIEEILELREVDSEDINRNFETWPVVEGIITLDEMRQLLPLVTCGGDVFRAQIIGYHEKNGLSHRSEFIIDATTVNPKVVFWRDLSHLGRGFDLSVLGIRNINADDSAN